MWPLREAGPDSRMDSIVANRTPNSAVFSYPRDMIRLCFFEQKNILSDCVAAEGQAAMACHPRLAGLGNKR